MFFYIGGYNVNTFVSAFLEMSKVYSLTLDSKGVKLGQYRVFSLLQGVKASKGLFYRSAESRTALDGHDRCLGHWNF
jgi:hypothetical protein